MNSFSLKKQIVSIDALNTPGVLFRVTSVFTRRGYNIENISVGQIIADGMVRLTIVALVEEYDIERILKQLMKIVDVVNVTPVDYFKSVERELAFIKIRTNETNKFEIVQLIKIFECQILDASDNGFIVELVGDNEKIESFINLISKENIEEVTRTGAIAMNRLSKTNVKSRLSVVNV